MEDLLRHYPKGRSAFRQALAYFDHQKIIIPSYTTLQDIFSRAFAGEDKRLSIIIESIPSSISDELAALIHREYGILPKEQFFVLAEFLDGESFDKKAALWEYYGKSSQIFSLYLRPIFLSVTFEYFRESSHISNLMDVLKSQWMS